MHTTIFKPADWFAPLKWADVFATTREVEMDIGCGKGGFLLWVAQTRPQSNFLGIERQFARLSKVDKKIHRLGLDNIRLIRVEASYFIGKLVPADSVTAYHILFPDPWPKARHAKRRFIHPAQLPLLARVLKPGAEWRVASDDPTYQAWVRDVMAAQTLFTAPEPAIARPEGWPPTRYEAKALRAGRQPLYWSFQRLATPWRHENS